MSGLADAVRDWTPGIPSPWPTLDEKVSVRPGGCTLVAGAPGALKSMLMLNWAMRMEGPTLYITLDTSKQMQAARVIAHDTSRPQDLVLKDMDDPDKRDEWIDWLEGWDERSLMRMLDTPCTATEVGEIIEAWTHYWGEVPVMTVVDDVAKLKGVKDYGSLDEALVELGRIAKRYNTVVAGVQHINRGGGGSNSRFKLREMKYSGEFEAPYVLGLYRPNEDSLRVMVLKNRTGEDDPDGNYFAELHADPRSVMIREKTYFELFRRNDGSANRTGAPVS